MIKHWKEIKKKLNLTVYNLLIVQDLWPAHFQIMLIISIKEFKKLNLNTDTMIENVKRVESIADSHCCLEYINVTDLLIEYNKNYQKNNWWKVKETIFYYIQTLQLWYQ